MCGDFHIAFDLQLEGKITPPGAHRFRVVENECLPRFADIARADDERIAAASKCHRPACRLRALPCGLHCALCSARGGACALRPQPCAWVSLRAKTTVEDDELTIDWPIVFAASKDKPVLFSALACADVLLTLDRRNFCEPLGQTTCGLRVLTPGEFLRIVRVGGRLP